MHALRLPVRAARRPQGGPFSINWDSPQSQDLYRWWPLARNDGKGNGMRLTEMVTGASMKANANDTPKMLFGGGAAYGTPSIEPPFPGWYLEPNTLGFTTTLPQRALAPPFTLMMWFYPHSVAARSTLWHKTGSNGGYRIGTNTSNNLHFTIGAVAVYNLSNCTYTTDAWHFFAVTVQAWASTARGYRYNLSTRSFVSGTASIGTDAATPNEWVLASGSGGMPLADCRVYRRALTEAEIRRHVEPQTRWDLYWQRRRVYFIPATAGATKSVTDTGAGNDAIAALAVSLGVTDTGAGSDALPGPAVALAVTDAGSGVEALSAAVAVALADALTGTDAIAQIACGVAVTDAGAGGDQVTVLASLTLTDSGAGLDTVSILQAILKSVADSGAGSDALTVGVSVQLADSGAGVDAIAAISALLALADSAGGTDAVVRFDSAAQIATIRVTLTKRSLAFEAAKRSVDFSIAARTMTFNLEGGDSGD